MLQKSSWCCTHQRNIPQCSRKPIIVIFNNLSIPFRRSFLSRTRWAYHFQAAILIQKLILQSIPQLKSTLFETYRRTCRILLKRQFRSLSYLSKYTYWDFCGDSIQASCSQWVDHILPSPTSNYDTSRKCFYFLFFPRSSTRTIWPPTWKR